MLHTGSHAKLCHGDANGGITRSSYNDPGILMRVFDLCVASATCAGELYARGGEFAVFVADKSCYLTVRTGIGKGAINCAPAHLHYLENSSAPALPCSSWSY